MGILYERVIKIMSEKLYHITLQDNLPLIYKTGSLVPQIGERSKAALEKKEYIYLCDSNKINYWRALLYGDKRSIVLEVDKADLDQESLNRYMHDEYTYDISIPVNKLAISMISIYPVPCYEIDECIKAVLYTCCYLCRYICDYNTWLSATLSEEKYYMNLIGRMSIIRFVSNNIDLNKFSKTVYTEIIRAYADTGEYTFLDTYGIKSDDTIRLYEKILDYHDDPCYDQIKWLNDFIKTTYKDILNTDTGGYEPKESKSAYENISPKTKM